MATSFPSKAKIVVVGAGAIGGLLGVHLSLQGHDVTFVARGAHLEAMKSMNALKVQSSDGKSEKVSSPGCKFVSSVLECCCVQDVIILGLKMHQINVILSDLNHVLGTNTVILTTQNGIPWWYFQCYTNGPKEYQDRIIESVDPGGLLMKGINPEHIIASVVYPAAFISSPGTITHVEGIRFPVGELNGSITTPRVIWISNMLIQAGFKSPILSDVRAELWLKLWGTVAVNPLSALTHATLDNLCAKQSPTRIVVERMMKEVEQVTEKLGSKMRLPMQRRIDGAASVGKHRTSMLQDVEMGRQLEIDTIIGSVVELAQLCQIDVPSIETIHGTLQMLQQVMIEEKSKVCLMPIDK